MSVALCNATLNHDLLVSVFLRACVTNPMLFVTQVFGDSDEEELEGSTHSGDKETRTPIDDEQDCMFVVHLQRAHHLK